MGTNLVNEAEKIFVEGFSCSQAILMTYCEQYGFDKQKAKVIARAFGGGMGRTCQTCGAVTGSYMVLGLKFEQENEKDAKNKTYELVKIFDRKFKEKHGSVNCKQLLGCDLGTSEGQDYYKQNHLNENCKMYVSDAATILNEIL